MELKLRKILDVYVIDVIGELDLYNTSQLKDLFGKMVDRNVERIIINLDGVHYLDSSGVGALINIFTIVKEKEIQFTLANVHSTAKKVLELTRLMGFFPISETIEEAVEQVRQI